ncbi:MAG: KUP/HAK/KT family potassium transporter [Acetobacteraceae bacterium]|nr:KUP/HAK/KT family potassium transporter [Acetobacteraceae bacterium]
MLVLEWLRLPMVFLAAAAIITAFQAVISGACSLERRCVQLSFLPRVILRHIRGTEEGRNSDA